MNEHTLAHKLKTLRTKRKMKQKDLAKELGVSSRYVSKWELAEGWIPTKYIPDLCRILNVPPTYFFEEDNEGLFDLNLEDTPEIKEEMKEIKELQKEVKYKKMKKLKEQLKEINEQMEALASDKEPDPVKKLEQEFSEMKKKVDKIADLIQFNIEKNNHIYVKDRK